MIEKEHPLASVNGSFNAVFVKGNYVGDIMFYGPGAGMFPTASAMLGDIMDIAMTRGMGRSHPAMCTALNDRPVVPMGETISEYYIRLRVKDQPGVLARIATICGQHGVSLKTVEQPEADLGMAELILITHQVKEAAIQAAVAEFNELDVVTPRRKPDPCGARLRRMSHQG
jgi:homoserine dehydrogenase